MMTVLLLRMLPEPEADPPSLASTQTSSGPRQKRDVPAGGPRRNGSNPHHRALNSRSRSSFQDLHSEKIRFSMAAVETWKHLQDRANEDHTRGPRAGDKQRDNYGPE